MLNIKRLFIIGTLFSVLFVADIFSQEKKINQLDENGKRTGVWKKFYNNGNLRYSGQFLEGKEVGVFKFFEKRASHPHIIKEFSSVTDTASVKFYTNLGKLKTVGKMIGKNRVGKWTYFFGNGKKLSEEHYSQGKLNGLLINYYPNGKITNKTNYKDGVKSGISKTYTDDGILIEEVNYVEGKLNGQAKYYDLKGVIRETGSYKNGKRIGKWDFYIDGEIAKKPKNIEYMDKE